MKDYLNLLGLDAKKLEFNNNKIKHEYEFEKYVMEGVECILLKPGKFNHKRSKKVSKIINEAYHCNVVMYLDAITSY